MTRIHGRLLGALTVAVLALAGCGTAPANGAASRPAATATRTARPVAAAKTSPAVPAPSPNQRRAEKDAVAILATFTAPPGAHRLTAAPSVSGGVLNQPGERPATPDLVDQAGWWLVPGGHQQALDWANAHRPHGSATAGTGSAEDGPGTTTWFNEFDLTAVPGVLDSRELIVTAAAAGKGQTAIRVDAEVIWRPSRASAEVVPAVADAVTLTLRPDGSVQAKPPAAVTVTDPARVRRLMALVDGLPVYPPGESSCPFDGGATLTLTFGTRSPRAALAVAVISLEGCEGVDFTIGGKPQPGLGSPDGGRPQAVQALKAAGLNWKLTSYR